MAATLPTLVALRAVVVTLLRRGPPAPPAFARGCLRLRLLGRDPLWGRSLAQCALLLRLLLA